MKQNKPALILAITLFFITSNCRVQAQQNITAIKKAIENTNTLYYTLFAKKDTAIVSLYTPDAALLVPNTAPIQGRQALIKDFTETFAAGNIKGVKFVTANIYGNGNEYMTEEGNWQVFNTQGKVIDDGKYLKLWKNTGGGWKIYRDVFNSSHAAKQ